MQRNTPKLLNTKMNIPKSFSTDKLIEILRGRGIKSILEMGCGPGYNLYWLGKELDAEIAGCDKYAVPEGANEPFDFKLIDLATDKIDYKSKSFDVVVFSATLYQIEKVDHIIKEAKRIAKKYILIAEFQLNMSQGIVIQDTITNRLEYWRDYRRFFTDKSIETFQINGWPNSTNTTDILLVKI